MNKVAFSLTHFLLGAGGAGPDRGSQPQAPQPPAEGPAPQSSPRPAASTHPPPSVSTARLEEARGRGRPCGSDKLLSAPPPPRTLRPLPQARALHSRGGQRTEPARWKGTASWGCTAQDLAAAGSKRSCNEQQHRKTLNEKKKDKNKIRGFSDGGDHLVELDVALGRDLPGMLSDQCVCLVHDRLILGSLQPKVHQLDAHPKPTQRATQGETLHKPRERITTWTQTPRQHHSDAPTKVAHTQPLRGPWNPAHPKVHQLDPTRPLDPCANQGSTSPIRRRHQGNTTSMHTPR